MKKENPEILNNFLNYLLSVKSFSIETINSYNIDLLLFFYFIKEYLELKIEVKDFNKFILLQVKEGDIIAFLVYCNHSRNNNVYTRQRKLMAIRCFYKWLFQNFPNDNVLKNPTEDIKSINKIQRIPKYLNLQEAKSIQKVFNFSNCRNPIRNNTIICLFLTAGLRVSELISIKFKDIDFNNKTIQIFGKGGKERTAYFNEYCKKQLLNYIKERNKNIKKVPINDYLFLNNRKQKLKEMAFTIFVKRLIN